ncbi:MAG TPA: YtxH domain-containing protein [Patescibacteria group bacterium]|nr:YtxH domain-containing protein [Patescibacteria group bacterium]
MNKSAKSFAIGTVVAAAAGYVAGILTAPKSGKETRADIKVAAEHGIAEAEKRLKMLHTELGKLIEEAKVKAGELRGRAQVDIEKAVVTAQTVKEKARELISAVHEGDADDKELKKAIVEANKSVDHLKTFLKKS